MKIFKKIISFTVFALFTSVFLFNTEVNANKHRIKVILIYDKKRC